MKNSKEKELSQDKIKFHNCQHSHLIGWNRNSPYKSFGNVIHWLYVFGNYEISEGTDIGDNFVKYHNKIIAKYTFDDNFLMPIFIDVVDDLSFIQDRQESYIKIAKTKKLVVLEHLTLPDRGFRFLTSNSDNITKLYTGEIVYKPIFFTDSVEEAQKHSKDHDNSLASYGELTNFYREKYKEEQKKLEDYEKRKGLHDK